VLEIVPHIANTVTGPELIRELLDLAPELVAYFLSFLVIGRFWDTHRNFFHHISLADARVSWINLLVLLWITLIPATAALLGSHWREPVALILYALNLLLATTSFWLLWRYVTSARYVQEEGLPATTRTYLDRHDRYAGVRPAGYALVIPVAFLSPSVALALVFLTTALARTIARRVLTPSATPQSASASRLQGQDANPMDEE
jgi:TMEM175 potassium channel family protein